MIRRPPSSTLFPSAPLFRSCRPLPMPDSWAPPPGVSTPWSPPTSATVDRRFSRIGFERSRNPSGPSSPHRNQQERDRKSTRLHSSHLVISYAVFCLKKKKHY